MHQMSRTQRVRNWCFTWNNPSLAPDELLQCLPTWPHLRYIVWQEERGENGTRHYQGYSEWLKAMTVAGLSKLMPGSHWEPRRGTQKQAKDYCTKFDTRVAGPWEYGEPASITQGNRSDLVEVAETLRTTKSLAETAMAHPATFIKYSNGLNRYKSLLCKPVRNNEDPFDVYLLIGLPGTGKSRWAREQYEHLYVKPVSSEWFDGLDAEDTVLFDDFGGRSSKIGLTSLLQLLDRYPLQVAVKGGFTWYCPRRVIITTNIHPDKWYDYSERRAHYQALVRRITKVKYFWRTSNGKYKTEDIETDSFCSRSYEGFTNGRIRLGE